MKKYILSVFGILISSILFGQSNPVPLKPGFNIQRLLTIKDGAIRMERDEINNQLYYILTTGEIYQVIFPTTGVAYDSLVFTVAQHGVQYVQGMTFHDSTWYVSGNNNSNSALTSGIIVRGKLQPNGTRIWDTLMHTVNYQTNGPFDHLFSGIVVSPSGDSIYICSGARGDHGEIETRNGLYPNLRNVPLTTNVFVLPTHNPSTITLQNDSMWLDTNGYIYARGTRNHFDMAFDQHGNLFALENSGDRDHNEEMNWLRRGRHYGFPWIMGETYNPQQYSWFNPANDKLINHNCRSWRLNAWSNDPTFPQPPPGLTFEPPIMNYGPDCDKFRDSLGTVHDASNEGLPIGTFTAHRSPLGLVFDNQNVLGPLYRGDAFMFSWTEGYDSTGAPPPPDTTHIGPFSDPSQDMVHLDLSFDSAAGNFRLNATRVVADFINPVDAEIDSNKVYVIENGYGGTSGLFVIRVPVEANPCLPTISVITLDPCHPDSNMIIIPPFGTAPGMVDWYNSAGVIIRSDTAIAQNDTILNLPADAYYARITDGGACPVDSVPFSIAPDMSITIDSVIHTTCIGCVDGEVIITVHNGMPPYSYTPSTIHLSAGVYNFCVTDANGCMACDNAAVLDDPTGIISLNKNNLKLFPNPAQDHLFIKNIPADITGINIFDAKGAKKSLSFIHDKNIVSIDLKNIDSGYYSVEIIMSDSTYYEKIVINK